MATPLSILDYRQPLEFRMGDVVVKAWRVLSRNFLTVVVLVGIAEMLPLLVAMAAKGVGPIVLSLLGMVVNVVASSFAQSVVVYAAFQDLRGGTVSARESILRGLSRFLPVILVSIVAGIAMVFGLMLLIVPGLIAIAAFQVAAPICVVERAGPFTSLSRSAELTRGYWWPILGVGISLMIVAIVVTLAIRAAFPLESSMAESISTWIWGVLTTSYSSVYAAILYHDLRAVKEGIGIEQIASVFD